MKLAACFLTLLPGFAVAASWTSPGFPAFSEQGTGTFVSHAQLPKGTRPLTLNFDQQCWQPADAIKLNQMLSLQPCSNTPPQWRLFKRWRCPYRVRWAGGQYAVCRCGSAQHGRVDGRNACGSHPYGVAASGANAGC